MTTAADLHDAVWAILDALPTVTGFDADVPTQPPADARGRVFPYAVLWPSPGATPAEASLAGPQGLDWMCQVTVAAGDPAWCLRAAGVVRAALVGVQLVPTAGPLVDETPRSRTLMRDPDVTPPRWFVPLLLGCLTA